MNKNWVVRAKRADFSSLAQKYHIDQVVARILINRGIPEDEFGRFLACDMTSLYEPVKLREADTAADILKAAIDDNRHIRVIGDYDIDGISSTYILTDGIKNLGGHVSFAIPHRMIDGYGLNMRLIDEAVSDGVDLIITCDNGISAYEEIAHAKEMGLSVIVTDHHEIPYEISEQSGTADKRYILPPADAVVDPHRADCDYPFPEICGAVVAWKVLICLYRKYGREHDADKYIEMAAFATIGDIMPLVDENRTIVKKGLEILSRTENAGMRSLIERSGLGDAESISSYHVGFVLGPCFNASGRLDTASMAVELLLETDVLKASELASELVTLNEERKAMTEKGTEEAISLIEKEGLNDSPVMVVYLPKLHESLNGIVAGRLKERYHRPVFVLSDGEEYVKGSGRSIEAYPMFERMSECRELFVKFGGHPMAAGLTIKREDIADFKSFITMHANLSKEDLIPKLYIDVPMPLDYISEALIGQLSSLEPFGAGNEKPVFADKELVIDKAYPIGKNKQYRKLILRTKRGMHMDGLYFGDADEFDKAYQSAAKSGEKLSIIYYPDINEYAGRRSIQVVIKEYKFVI